MTKDKKFNKEPRIKSPDEEKKERRLSTREYLDELEDFPEEKEVYEEED